MDEILVNLVPKLEYALQILGGLAVVATVIVRITPSKTDDEKVGKIVGYIIKLVRWMPTVGVNPKTKELEKAYEELKAKQQPPPQ